MAAVRVICYLLVHYGFLQNYLKKVPFDLCHVFFGFPTGLLGLLFHQQVPYLVSVRGSDVPGYNARFSWDYFFLKPFLKKIYQKSQAVVANSQGLRHLFESQYPTIPASVIPNGVDTRLFLPAANKPAEPFSIVTVARLIPRKGIDVLIRACGLLEKAQIPFQCHVVGDGPETSALKAIAQEEGIADKILFYGQLEKWQVSSVLAQGHLFVLPSYAEGMPNAALEAMACGLPLILTDTGGSDELISGNGEIVPKGQVMPLFSTLHSLIVQPDLLREMSRQSRRLAEQMAWSQVANQYHDLYHEIVRDLNSPD